MYHAVGGSVILRRSVVRLNGASAKALIDLRLWAL